MTPFVDPGSLLVAEGSAVAVVDAGSGLERENRVDPSLQQSPLSVSSLQQYSFVAHVLTSTHEPFFAVHTVSTPPPPIFQVKTYSKGTPAGICPSSCPSTQRGSRSGPGSCTGRWAGRCRPRRGCSTSRRSCPRRRTACTCSFRLWCRWDSSTGRQPGR